MINNEFCILCTGFSYSRQLILKRGYKISLKNIYYWSTILNNGLFSSINYVWNKIDKRVYDTQLMMESYILRLNWGFNRWTMHPLILLGGRCNIVNYIKKNLLFWYTSSYYNILGISQNIKREGFV